MDLRDLDLIDADGGMHLKRGHSRVLADGRHVCFRHVHVQIDDVQSLSRLGAFRFALIGAGEGAAHVGGQVGSGFRNQSEQAVTQLFHNDGFLTAMFGLCSG